MTHEKDEPPEDDRPEVSIVDWIFQTAKDQAVTDWLTVVGADGRARNAMTMTRAELVNLAADLHQQRLHYQEINRRQARELANLMLTANAMKIYLASLPEEWRLAE